MRKGEKKPGQREQQSNRLKKSVKSEQGVKKKCNWVCREQGTDKGSREKNGRGEESDKEVERGETITSLECGQSQTGPRPKANHRACLVPVPSSGRLTNGWIHVETKRLCSSQMEL